MTAKSRAGGGPKLPGLVWPFVAVVLAQVLIASLSIHMLSSVRAYVGGESLWSKGQKDAIYFLSMYADTGRELYYDEFEKAIALPLADRAGRLALEGEKPDLEAAEAGFLGGGNHPADVPGQIWLYRNFRDVSYFATSVQRWVEADPAILELLALGRTIHAETLRGEPDTETIAGWKAAIHRINAEVSPLALGFSEALGEGSRAITRLLLFLNLATAALLIGLAVWRTGKLLGQRQAFEAAFNAERERARITLASIGQAVITTDTAGRVDYLNAAAEDLTGWQVADGRGRRIGELFRLVREETGEEDERLVERLLAGEAIGPSATPQQLVRADLSSVPVSFVGAPLVVDGLAAGAVLVFHDMTREREYIDQLAWQASHDSLTSLANRREFESRLEWMIGALGEPGVVHALMYLDLDQFKIVNDTCGHAAGDELLRRVSQALERHIRPGDLLARLGGDEFGVLLEDCSQEHAAEAAERLRRAVSEIGFCWEQRTFAISVSIGLVVLSDPRATMESILRSVDVACYMAKEKGRDRVQQQEVDDGEMRQRVGEMDWVQRIREALEQRRFRLWAQEIAAIEPALEHGRHVELLLRLEDANGNMVSPGLFIPPAERYGLMPLLDRWVVSTAFEMLARARWSGPGNEIAVCAINLSGASFGDETFIDFVRQEFARHGVRPSTICFEITETSAIADLASASRFVTALQALGCRFALDDFGSGMSSFAYLKRLPVDYIKIDGSFVKDMLSDRGDRAMVEMIQHIGRVMGKRTIAEFVENEGTLAALREIGVDYAQGYVIDIPRPFVVDEHGGASLCETDGSLQRPRLRA